MYCQVSQIINNKLSSFLFYRWNYLKPYLDFTLTGYSNFVKFKSSKTLKGVKFKIISFFKASGIFGSEHYESGHLKRQQGNVDSPISNGIHTKYNFTFPSREDVS